MAVISGKDGQIKVGATTIADITNWSLNTTSNNPAYASSATGGHKKRVAGVKDGSGSLAFKLDIADAITTDFEEGSAVTLLLYLNATLFYTVPAIIDAVRLEVDVENGEIVGGTMDFSKNGAHTKPTYA